MNLRRIHLVDALVLALLALSLTASLAGGLPWGGRTILRHAADPRRAAILVALAGALLSARYRAEGLVPRVARAIAAALERPEARWTTIAVWVALMSSVSILQALALRYPLWDVGIFHQIIWALTQGHGFWSSISGAGDFLRDHLSPSLALLAPAFWLTGSSALMLPVAHALLLGAGGAAWVWLAERLGGPRLAAATTIFVVSFDSLWGNRHWGFHENAVSFAALSWALALILTGRTWAPLALLAIAAGAKETLLLEVGAMIGLWAIIATPGTKQSLPARIAKIAAAAALGATFLWFQSIEHPADKNYFARYYAYLGLNSADFARALLTAPGRVLEHVGAFEIARYLKTVFLPFFPIAWLVWRRDPRALWLVAITTSFLSALLATYPPLRQPGFHYVLELWPILAPLAIAALARLPSHWAWAWALLALLSLDRDPIGGLREFGVEAMRRSEARARMGEIPPEASVAASELAGPWLASRRSVTRLPVLWEDRCPDWVVVQEGDPAGAQVLERCPTEPRWKAADWQGFARAGQAN